MGYIERFLNQWNARCPVGKNKSIGEENAVDGVAVFFHFFLVKS